MLSSAGLDIRNRKSQFLPEGDKNHTLPLSDESAFLPKDSRELWQ